jgi:hypothetical protein
MFVEIAEAFFPFDEADKVLPKRAGCERRAPVVAGRKAKSSSD